MEGQCPRGVTVSANTPILSCSVFGAGKTGESGADLEVERAHPSFAPKSIQKVWLLGPIHRSDEPEASVSGFRSPGVLRLRSLPRRWLGQGELGPVMLERAPMCAEVHIRQTGPSWASWGRQPGSEKIKTEDPNSYPPVSARSG